MKIDKYIVYKVTCIYSWLQHMIDKLIRNRNSSKGYETAMSVWFACQINWLILYIHVIYVFSPLDGWFHAAVHCKNVFNRINLIFIQTKNVTCIWNMDSILTGQKSIVKIMNNKKNVETSISTKCMKLLTYELNFQLSSLWSLKHIWSSIFVSCAESSLFLLFDGNRKPTNYFNMKILN